MTRGGTMIEEVENKLLVELEDIFDGLAKPTLEVQKRKLGLSDEISLEEYEKLIEEIRNATRRLAGERVAEEAFKKLRKILDEHRGG